MNVVVNSVVRVGSCDIRPVEDSPEKCVVEFTSVTSVFVTLVFSNVVKSCSSIVFFVNVVLLGSAVEVDMMFETEAPLPSSVSAMTERLVVVTEDLRSVATIPSELKLEESVLKLASVTPAMPFALESTDSAVNKSSETTESVDNLSEISGIVDVMEVVTTMVGIDESSVTELAESAIPIVEISETAVGKADGVTVMESLPDVDGGATVSVDVCGSAVDVAEKIESVSLVEPEEATAPEVSITCVENVVGVAGMESVEVKVEGDVEVEDDVDVSGSDEVEVLGAKSVRICGHCPVVLLQVMLPSHGPHTNEQFDPKNPSAQGFFMGHSPLVASHAAPF